MCSKPVRASSPAVSDFMRRVRRKHTGPEIALRRELHRAGVRFRLHRPGLPGRPDIVLVRTRVAVFVDGCFWHGCPDHFVRPKANAGFWRAKIRSNRARDRRVDDALGSIGWAAIHVWEHEEPAVVAQTLSRLWAEGARDSLADRPPR